MYTYIRNGKRWHSLFFTDFRAQNFRNLEFRSKILEFSRKSLSLEEFFKGFIVKNGKFRLTRQ